MDPNGEPSNEDNTLVDHGFARLPGPPGAARPAAVGVHQRRRHAARLVPRPALRAARGAGRTCASSRATSRGLYGKWGFRDSVNVADRRVSGAYLSLDQGMIMAALGNALGDDVLRRAFADRELERALRPVIGIEQFQAGR